MISFQPACRATTVGSLPLDDAGEATRLVLTYTPEVPAWVQLAKRPREGMLVQFTEGMAGLNRSSGKLFFDAGTDRFHQEVSLFYQHYLEIDADLDSPLLESFSLTPAYAHGFTTLIEALTHSGCSPTALKGQATGSFTLATSITDQEGKNAFYNPQLRDIIVKTVALKALWQIQKLQLFGVPVIISLDEPSLAGFGSSAYIGITAADVQHDISEIVTLIHRAGGYAALHCCENTDWSMVLDTGIDMLSFDAYSFFDKLLLYAGPLKAFIDRGGLVAWGLVPTSRPEYIEKETAGSLIAKWEAQVELLARAHLDTARVAAQSFITPSCGAGSLSPEQALRVLQLLREVSRELRTDHRG